MLLAWSTRARNSANMAVIIKCIHFVTNYSGSRRITFIRGPFVRASSKLIIRSVKATGIQSLIGLDTRLCCLLLLLVIQNIFWALSFNLLARHFLKVLLPYIHWLLHQIICITQSLSFLAFVIKAIRRTGCRHLIHSFHFKNTDSIFDKS